MLIVKDFKKLEEHGFVKRFRNLDLWEYPLAEHKTENGGIYLLVNPFNVDCTKNEMFVYGDHVGVEELDLCANIDVVFEMIADGTIEYVKGDK